MLKRAMVMAAAMLIAAGSAAGQDKPAPSKPATKQASESSMPSLMVGDKAPALAVGKWVKGDEVKEFEKGKTYVVDFWATWCGPCKASIPHMSEMQRTYKDVKFIGVSVWEADQGKVDPFIAGDLGKKMEYSVAMDNVPPLPEGTKAGTRDAQKFSTESGRMSAGWLKAAESHGIPTVMIVKDQKIAYIGTGYPQPAFDEALKDIAAGKYDIAKAAESYKGEKAAEAPTQEFLRLMMGEKNLDAAYELANAKFDLLKNSSQSLNQIAWLIVDPDNKPEKQDLKLAEKAAVRAVELTKEKDGAILDTLGAVYFAMGNLAKAIEVQEKAVKLTADDAQQGADIKDRLEKYKKAAKDGGS